MAVLLTSQIVNGGDSLSFTYDNDGLLTGAGNLSISRNPHNGSVTGTTLGNLSDSYSYNSFGELTGISSEYNSSPLFNSSYTLDSLGRIQSIIETVDGTTNTFEYGYNTIEYLINVRKNGVVTSEYGYDQNGNRTTLITNNDTITGIYDDQDRVLSYRNNTYIYGKRGDLQKKIVGTDTTRYNYDNLGNLRGVILPDGELIEYLIDGQNRRIAKLINGSVVKRWIYQNQLNPVAELDSSGKVTARFVYGTRTNMPDYIIKNDSVYRVIPDHLGSARIIINISNGEIAQRINYDEFGNVLINTNEDFQPFTFAGGLYDKSTNLVRFGARDYDAEVGRWISKDPILFEGGTSNLYEYVINDPINIDDPTGLHKGDKGFKGYPKVFVHWSHIQRMKGALQDLNPQEIKALYKEWLGLGKPGPDTKGIYGKRGGGKGELLGLGPSAALWELHDILINALKSSKDPCQKGKSFWDLFKQSFDEYLEEPTLFEDMLNNFNDEKIFLGPSIRS